MTDNCSGSDGANVHSRRITLMAWKKTIEAIQLPPGDNERILIINNTAYDTRDPEARMLRELGEDHRNLRSL